VAVTTVAGQPLVAGAAEGTALVLDAPLSFWGGYDPVEGRIIDTTHPQRGEVAAGRVLVLPSGRGSSSSSSVLAEAIRLGTAPAAIVLGVPDPIILVGSLVARELYGVTVPVVVAGPEGVARLRTGERVLVHPDGRIVTRPGDRFGS
jgi:uncharacterized protein